MITSSIDLIISPPRPIANRVIHVHIEGLRPLDGGGVMDPIDEWFITKLDPHYSTVMRVRMVAGEFLTEVPDPTIDQLIQYYSHQADLLNFMPERSEQDPTKYKNYRARWVTASVVVLLLSGTSINSMLQKRLGDLMVKRDKPAIQLLGRQQKELEDLTDILQDGGYYGRSIKTAVKGLEIGRAHV